MEFDRNVTIVDYKVASHQCCRDNVDNDGLHLHESVRAESDSEHQRQDSEVPPGLFPLPEV